MEVRQLGLTFVSIKSLLSNFSCLLVSVWDNNVHAFTQFDLTVNFSSHSAICRWLNLVLLLCHCFELNKILNDSEISVCEPTISVTCSFILWLDKKNTIFCCWANLSFTEMKPFRCWGFHSPSHQKCKKKISSPVNGQGFLHWFL